MMKGDNRKMEKLLQDQSPQHQKKGTNRWQLWFKNLFGVAACLASGLFKGPVPATSRYVENRGYTPYQILFLDDLLIFLVALCITVYQRPNMQPNDWKHGIRLLFQGLARFTSILCLFTSYQFVPPANAEAVWSASMPVFVVALSCIFLRESPTRVTMFGIPWCVTGVALLGYGNFVHEWSSTDTANIARGMVLAITGALIHSMLDVGAKGLLQSTSREKLVTYTYAISAAFAGIGACITSSTWHLEPQTARVLAVSCVSHGTCMFFFYLGLKLVEVNAVTALMQLSAFSAYGLQWALLGFSPTVLDGLGLTCVLIGTSSVAIWEAHARWKEERKATLMKELHFKVTTVNDD